MLDPIMEPGGTPLLCVDGIHVKLECANPCGSIKDRIARYIIERSEQSGRLRPGMTIVEASSGNTGIALSYYGRQSGYPVVIVMPEDMTIERKQSIRDLGATLIECKPSDFAGAAATRDEMAQAPEFFSADQFANPLNAECHEKTTGVELLDGLEGQVPRVDAFVAGVGTGGTLIGVGRALRRRYPEARLVAVEPAESAVMTGGAPGPHGIGGIGDGFIPELAGDGHGGLHPSIDEVIVVTTAEAMESAATLRDQHGFCVGVSSGANFLAAKRLSERYENVATVFPDGYFKYQSQGLKRCKLGDCEFEQPRTGVLRTRGKV